MFRLTVIAVVLLTAQAVRAKEIPENLKPKVERLQQLQEQELARLEQGVKKTGLDYRFQIEKAQKQIDAIKRGEAIPVMLDCQSLSVGQIGWLGCDALKVLQVLSAGGTDDFAEKAVPLFQLIRKIVGVA